ncbi:Hypothetical predicted protein [Olea europaea subsp. europaea]|uniref:Uncharacterized protein n=1 Tax=Olea europaea subsp. europaea TaxID=158383 RepID=A0A8S0QJB1_OLEEU|nr:Hypothetical predicted protein [Olea europaea subsp. europaea]
MVGGSTIRMSEASLAFRRFVSRNELLSVFVDGERKESEMEGMIPMKEENVGSTIRMSEGSLAFRRFGSRNGVPSVFVDGERRESAMEGMIPMKEENVWEKELCFNTGFFFSSVPAIGRFTFFVHQFSFFPLQVPDISEILYNFKCCHVIFKQGFRWD